MINGNWINTTGLGMTMLNGLQGDVLDAMVGKREVQLYELLDSEDYALLDSEGFQLIAR